MSALDASSRLATFFLQASAPERRIEVPLVAMEFLACELVNRI